MTIKTRTEIIIPTAINLLCAVNEGIVQNRRRGLDAEIVLPSLRVRARMVVGEVGVLPLQQIVPDDTGYFTR